jgi:hypothetical protein
MPIYGWPHSDDPEPITGLTFPTIILIGTVPVSLDASMVRPGSITGLAYHVETGIGNAGGSQTRVNFLKNGAAWFSSTSLGTDLAGGVCRTQTWPEGTYAYVAGDIITAIFEVLTANLAGATGAGNVTVEIDE